MDWVVPLATVVIGGLLTGGLITAIVAARREQRQAPIERQQARDAMVKADYDRAMALIAQQQEQIAGLITQIQAQDARITIMDERAITRDRSIAQLETKVAQLMLRDALWRRWATQIHDSWSVLRLDPVPPPLPSSIRLDEGNA